MRIHLLRRIRLVMPAALSLALLGVGPGCNDPAAEIAAAKRQAHAREVWETYKAHDAAGTERLAETRAMLDEVEVWHAEHLARDKAYLRERWQFEQERWADQASYERRIEQELEGDPEAAQRAFRALFY